MRSSSGETASRGRGPRCWRIRRSSAFTSAPNTPRGGALSNRAVTSSRLLKKRMTTALLFSTRSSGGPAGDPRGVRLPADLRSSGPVRSPSYRLGREVSNPNEVVDGQGKGKHPVHAAGPAMTGLSHQADGLEPAEDLLDALPPTLAHPIAAMAGGPPIDRAGALGRVLGDVRRDAEQPNRLDEIPRVVALVSPERHSTLAILSPHELQGGCPLGVAARRRHAAIDGEPVSVLHQDVAGVVELGFVRVAFAEQAGVGVRRGRVGRVAAPLAVKIHGRIARVVRRRGRRVFPLEALEAGPGLDQRAVHGEMLEAWARLKSFKRKDAP